MQSVRVSKSRLLNILEGNLKKHREKYERAIAGYRLKMARALRVQAEACDEGKNPKLVALPKPENHTEDYERIIGMIKLSTDSVIELLQAEYDSYVRDMWQWAGAFNSTFAAYSNAGVARRKK